MKKKKYDWPKRCLSLICVLVLIGMIILQSVPVTYASDNDEVLQRLEQSAATSEPEENSQMISTTETLPDEGIPTGTQLVNDIFQEGNTESSSGIHADGNYENQTNNISGEENSDIASDNTSGNGEEGDYNNSSDIPSQPEQGTDSNVNADQNSGLTDDQDIANEIQSGENPEDSEGEQPDTESNANPVQENEDIWRNSVAGAILSNDYAKDLVAIARTQLGVQENRDNFITTAEGVNHYYSRYGQWAGDAYEEWSAAFVNFCIHYANIPQQYLPKSENVSQWIQQLEAMSLHISKEGYTPKEGDLVFFLKNEHAEGNSQIQTEFPAHAGIVTGADEQTLYTIEGNCGGMVQTETYAISSDNIYGYLDMDQVKKLAGVLREEEEPVNPETPADSQNPTDSETPSEADTTKPETPSDSEAENPDENAKDNDESNVLEWNGDNVTIVAEELSEGAISEGTTLNVIPIEENKNETAFQYAEVEAELRKKAETEEYEITGFLAYNIQLVNADGESYEPAGKVKISIKYNEPEIPELKEADVSNEEINITVMHLEEDESGNVTAVTDLAKTDAGENLIQTIETTKNQEIQNVEFTTGSLSTYAITWNSNKNIRDVQGNSLTQEQYEQYLNTMLASVEGTANGNLPITDWKRSSGYVNADLNLTTSATADSTTNSNWWNTVSGLDTSITNVDDVWDGSRNQTHEFTGYLPDKTVTVYNGALYDSATWKDHHNGDNNGSVYRFQGTFNIGADDPNDCTYTIQQVTGNDRLYINDDMWVFIYPEGTSITSSNYMDYLAFWTGTRNQNSSVKYFNDRLGTVATKDGDASKLSGLTKLTDGWNMVSVTDNAGAIIQSVYNKGNHATNYVIDVFAEDYNTGGGTYRLTVNKQRQPKATVKLKKMAADGKTPLAGAVFAVDDASNSVHYTAISGEDGTLSFSLLNNNTYTLSELKAPNGYKKTADKWTIIVKGDGSYTIEKQENGQELERLNDEEGTYYITNTSSVTVVTEKELSHEKYIKYNSEDKNYDLTLNVSGAAGTASTQYELDVLFVMDTSNSMIKSMTTEEKYSNYTTNSDSRFYNQQKAIENAITTLEQKKNVDARYAVVAFDTKAGTVTQWTDGKNVSYPEKVANYSVASEYAGGTNYQDALAEAGKLLNSARETATTIVIFLSDGDPTFYNAGNSVAGNGSSYDEKAMKNACQVLQGMSMNYFYMVGVGPTEKYSKLNTMKTSVPDGTVTDNAYNGTSADALKTAFDSIIAEATELLCTDVTVTDTLSAYAKIADSTLSDGLKVLVKDEEGNEITSLKYRDSETPVKDVVTASLQPEDNPTQITLNFAKGYQLESGYTYYVTAKIEPTEAAYEYYRTHDFQYPDTGESYTDENPSADKKPGSDTVNNGTSSNQPGFFSNDQATVSYTYNGLSKTEAYKNPVIQIDETQIHTEVNVDKIWKDGNNLNETRPDSIRLTLQYRVKNHTDSNTDNAADTNNNEWQIYQSEDLTNPFELGKDSQDEKDVNLWKTTITGLPTWINGQEVEYRIIEDATAGYETEQTAATTLTNKAKWKIVKQNAEPDKNGDYQRLSGAEFTLSEQTAAAISSDSSETSEKIIATGVSGSGEALGIIQWTSVSSETNPKTDMMENLNGTYILRETKAPAGYIRNTEEWTLEFADGVLTRINGNKIGKDEQNEITCYLGNKKAGELPDTGGAGNFSFTISGVTILMAGALLLYINKRKEEKTA